MLAQEAKSTFSTQNVRNHQEQASAERAHTENTTKKIYSTTYAPPAEFIPKALLHDVQPIHCENSGFWADISAGEKILVA